MWVLCLQDFTDTCAVSVMRFLYVSLICFVYGNLIRFLHMCLCLAIFAFKILFVASVFCYLIIKCLGFLLLAFILIGIL